ncbi:MAG: dihydroorotate dehydrogenase electron transfer subunit [Spirochaetales bacterium]|nr:dihydroorotate dehydrogenase electron transfer subunit [Spirochaetales bacterium]
MIQKQCKVISNKLIAKDYYELVFNWESSFNPKPGQFLTLRPQGLPLLRRPFAFSSFKDNRAAIIYKTVGKATKGFSSLTEKDSISILGPLGSGFDLPKKRPVLIAGGIGLGPMLFTAIDFAERGLSPILVIGARDKSFIPKLELGKGVEVVIATDDGSLGFKGNVTQCLKTEYNNILNNCEILCCGPHIMLKACHELALEYDIECQVSMEEMMACAVGACYGCVVETTHQEKYKRVCKDGPVFNSREIVWI